MKPSPYDRNIPLVFAMNALWMFLVLMPVIVPFYQDLGLDMRAIYTLQAAFGAALFVLEVPSGYAADLFGRKATLMLATLFHGLGFAIFAFAHGFPALLAGEIVLAIAVSLFSGTDVSMIYDSMAASGSTKAPIKMIGRKVFYQQLGETAGGLVGGWLVLWSLRLPVTVQAFVAWLPVLAVLAMVEPPRERMKRTAHRENLAYIRKSLFGHSALLSLVILNTVSFATATLIAVWAFQKYWQTIGIGIAWFGYLWALSNLIVAITARYAHKLEKALGSAAAVSFMALLPVVGYLGMAWTDAAWGALFCTTFQLSRGVNAVVMRDALNRRVNADMRATANSVVSLGVRAAFLVGGPLAGWGMDRLGTAPVFTVAGAVFAAAFLFLTVPFLKLRREFAPIP
ncbi:MAG: hypothetical protein AUJ52_14195 [Elusimicrobia bacterium CG1_02_63_36]|nr:MAG: hypothetical protein AUJ52_14195 [Elusimicrobia bacterium CG1_02_63_36]PJA17802.1 MAG: hypothetical protein COX66_03170 [Elusimicrobia bacterium CG_4_10_14_0_2_um_filter_63_34]